MTIKRLLRSGAPGEGEDTKGQIMFQGRVSLRVNLLQERDVPWGDVKGDGEIAGGADGALRGEALLCLASEDLPEGV